MALHPRLIAHRRSGSGQFLGESLVCAAAAMLLIGFALLPWHAGDNVQAAPSDRSELLVLYLVPLAGLMALAAAGWGAAQRQHAHSAAALALVAGSLALVYFARFALTEAEPAIGSGFVLAAIGAMLLQLQIYLPRPLPPGITQAPFDQNIVARMHWLRSYVPAIGVLAFLAWLAPQIAAKPTYRIVQSGILGVLDGSLYALIALGIIIINKATGVFNFGHGAMILIGGMMMFSFFENKSIHYLVALAYACIVTSAVLFTSGNWRQLRRLMMAIIAALGLSALLVIGGADWWLLHGIVGTLMGAMMLGLFIERLAIRPLIGQPVFAIVMVTLALDILLRGLVRAFWGTQSVTIPLLYFIPRPSVHFSVGGGRVFIFTAALFGMVLALLAYTAFILFFRYSRAGLAMRAAAENQRLAQSLGLQVRVLLSLTWGLAAIFAALAGTLLGASKGIAAEITPALALKAFPAVLLGGLESIPGALIGGLLLGIAEQYSVLLFTTDVATQLVPFALLMIVLIIRPQGLFGLKRIERI